MGAERFVVAGSARQLTPTDDFRLDSASLSFSFDTCATSRARSSAPSPPAPAASMPPKGGAPKGGAKGKKGGGGDDDDDSPSGTCNQVKVRHILCEKQGKCLEALKEITGYTKEDGVRVEPVKFNIAAQKYSEDKAKEVSAAQRSGAECSATQRNAKQRMRWRSERAPSLTRAGAAQGGNLGWKRRDELNGVFAEAAFKLAKGKARRLKQ